MGWCSATQIFDLAIKSAVTLQKQTLKANNDPVKLDQAIIEFAKDIRDELEAEDWDCQNESIYFDTLGKQLWPEHWEDDDN